MFYVLAIALQVSLFWSLEVEADPIDNPQPASIEEIGVKVISNRHRKLDTNLEPSPQNGDVKNQEFLVLVDTWWKILAWSAAVLVLSCLCCYFSRCCYLCWDCCSDPFWGCCPQSQGCRRFLLMKGCCEVNKPRLKRKGTYTICKNTTPFKDEETGQDNLDDDDLSVEDFTLRTVESLEVDAMLDKFSPIKGKNQSDQGGKLITSTPRRKKSKRSLKNIDAGNDDETGNKGRDQEVEAIFLELSGEAESMPQFYSTHYFNILNLFGIGCSNYKVSTVEDRHRKYMTGKTTPGAATSPTPPPRTAASTTINSTGGKSFTANEDSTVGLASDDEELIEVFDNRSFDRSVINNQDFPLSSSFSNMYKKNGLHIEEGRVGRYHPLPEARFELLPPADFLRNVKRQNSTGGLMRRRSRSMETFKNQGNANHAKKYASGTLNHKEQSLKLLDVDESSLPSPPPVPSPPKTVEKRHTNSSFFNGNISSTTDEELEFFHNNNKQNGGSHKERSRIGHRRTPSMEGVAQIQQNGAVRHSSSTSSHLNNNKKMSRTYSALHQSSELPPKAPSNYKKRYSHRRMKMMDFEGDDIEKCILYGKETTL